MLRNFITKLSRKFTPNNHQDRVRKKLKKTDALLVFHGMGTGKTLTSIHSSDGDTNVITPAPLRKNFYNTLKNFEIKDNQEDQIFDVMSYEGASRYGVDRKKTLIVDEIQRIGNSGSARSQAVLNAAKYHDKRIALSGTPASNHPYELAPIMRFLSPDNKNIPLNPTEFNKKFISEKEVKIPFWKRVMGIENGIEYDIKNQDALMNAIKGKIDYHESGDENFPKRINITKKIEMDPEQTKYYRYVTGKSNPLLAMKIRMGLPLSKKESKQLNAFMTAARQVSNTTIPFGGSGISPKIKQVVDDVKSMKAKDKNFKGVIYSNYIGGGLSPISELLNESNINHGLFTGKLNDKKKQNLVDRFNSGKDEVLLISGAGAEGLDLKGGKSIQLLEPHWNKNKPEQVIARAIRYKSHDHLPEDEREVKVIKYQSILPKTTYQELLGKKRDISSDEYLEELSEKKYNLLSKFLDIFKEEGKK